MAGPTFVFWPALKASRGKIGLKIYTDSIELLKEYASVVRERPMASKLYRKRHEGKRLAEIFAVEPLAKSLGKTQSPPLIKREPEVKVIVRKQSPITQKGKELVPET